MSDSRALGELGSAQAAAVRAAVASGIGAAAGRSGFRTRRRRYDLDAVERRERRLLQLVAQASFIVLVALPGVLVMIYYGALAEDRYVSETRFLLRVNEAEMADGLGDLTGLPSIEMRRDTQVIASFLESASLVSALETAVGISTRVEGPQPTFWQPETWVRGDWLARLDPRATAEDRLQYWLSTSDVEVELPAGIVVLETSAFSAEDARTLAAAALEETSTLVNMLNDRAWSASLVKAETIFRDAAERLAGVQGALAVARNEAGLISVDGEAGMRTGLAGQLRADLVRLEQDRSAKAAHLAPGSAQLAGLDRRIETLRGEIARLGDLGVAENATLADKMARFSELEVEQDLAERQFLAAARMLERVREAARAERIYLDIFVPPTVPDEATRPRRLMATALWMGGLLLLWAIVAGSYPAVRRHLG